MFHFRNTISSFLPDIIIVLKETAINQLSDKLFHNKYQVTVIAWYPPFQKMRAVPGLSFFMYSLFLYFKQQIAVGRIAPSPYPPAFPAYRPVFLSDPSPSSPYGYRILPAPLPVPWQRPIGLAPSRPSSAGSCSVSGDRRSQQSRSFCTLTSTSSAAIRTELMELAQNRCRFYHRRNDLLGGQYDHCNWCFYIDDLGEIS